VEAVQGHARTLALLAPALRTDGVDATLRSLVELMAEMERKFPGSREKSLFAGVELSLRRLSPANRDRARVLGVFHGGVQMGLLRKMMDWEEADLILLARELIQTGLATANRYSHLSLNPALCPYLRSRMDDVELETLTSRWGEAMGAYTEFLRQHQSRKAEMAATLTLLELPNLFALLDRVRRARDAEATIELATSLYSLLQRIGKPRLVERVERVERVRDAATAALGGTWNHAQFEAQRTRIEQQLASGRFREPLIGVEQLLLRAWKAGEVAYPEADYDLATGCWLMARVFQTAGQSEEALPLLDDARIRFEAFEASRPNRGAERMASVCVTENGDCLVVLGRLDEAATAYEEGYLPRREAG
jgi:hypothetical protein